MDEDDDPIRYDFWIEEALRSVILRALNHAAEFGLHDEHHFYVSFRTDTDNVVMPDYLRAQHPGEMTIVLQHQYEDLSVSKDGFSVTLRFGGKPERLFVPINEITGFTDPSVNFGLQLSPDALDLDDFDIGAESDDNDAESNGAQRNEDEAAEPDESSGDADVAEESKTGEVIALDAFRKK